MHPKIQHTVPKFLLKGFVNGKKKQLFVFDKYTDKIFQSNTSRIAVGNAFYDIELNDELISLEESLAGVESDAAVLIEKIRKEKSIKFLTDTDKDLLSYFVSLQYTRVSQRRKESMEMNKVFALKLSSMGADIHNIENFKLMSEEENKLFSIMNIPKLASEISKSFKEKYLILEESNKNKPLYISDNPVVKYNSRKSEYFSTLGFTSEGIEVMVPISNTLCLHYICPRLVENIIVNFEETIKTYNKNNNTEAVKQSMMIYRGIFEKETCSLSKQNVDFMNSLQVSRSERWLYSSDGNFETAQDIIKKDGSARLGPTVTVN